jgi:hypothetical protein
MLLAVRLLTFASKSFLWPTRATTLDTMSTLALIAILCYSFISISGEPVVDEWHEAKVAFNEHVDAHAKVFHELARSMARRAGLEPSDDVWKNAHANKTAASLWDGAGEEENLTELMTYSELHAQLESVLLSLKSEYNNNDDEHAPSTGRQLMSQRTDDPPSLFSGSVPNQRVPRLVAPTRPPVVPRKLIDPTIQNRLKVLAQQETRSGCEPGSLAGECLSIIGPDLTILGATGVVGADLVLGLTGGVEMVFDSSTFEVGFFIFSGHYAGSDILLLQASASLFAGMGFKGKAVGESLKKSYEGFFLCGAFGGNLLVQATISACVSANGYTSPLFDQVKTFVISFG